VSGRGMSAAMLAAIAQERAHFVHLIEFQFDSGTTYHTDCHRDLTRQGNTYNSDANLDEIPTISEEDDLRVGSVKLSLTGAAQANIAAALTEDSVDRRVLIYVGVLDANDGLVEDPVVIYDGRIDGCEITEDADGGESGVTWTLASHWADWDRVNGRRTTDADQQRVFSGDGGMKFAAQIVTDLRWGSP